MDDFEDWLLRVPRAIVCPACLSHSDPSTVVEVPADWGPGQLFLLPPTPEEQVAQAVRQMAAMGETIDHAMGALRDASHALLESVRMLEGKLNDDHPLSPILSDEGVPRAIDD